MKREVQWPEPPYPDEAARRRALRGRMLLAAAVLLGLIAGIFAASPS